MGIAFYFEDLYCTVGGAGCKAAAVIIKYCIVLRKSVLVLIKEEVRCRKTSIRVERGPYYHVIMTRVGDNLCHVDTEFWMLWSRCCERTVDLNIGAVLMLPGWLKPGKSGAEFVFAGGGRLKACDP